MSATDPIAEVMSAEEEMDFTLFLGRRYGDGLVYLQGSEDRVLLESAIELGLVNEDGYLTPRGYRFWQNRQG